MQSEKARHNNRQKLILWTTEGWPHLNDTRAGNVDVCRAIVSVECRAHFDKHSAT